MTVDEAVATQHGQSYHAVFGSAPSTELETPSDHGRVVCPARRSSLPQSWASQTSPPCGIPEPPPPPPQASSQRQHHSNGPGKQNARKPKTLKHKNEILFALPNPPRPGVPACPCDASHFDARNTCSRCLARAHFLLSRRATAETTLPWFPLDIIVAIQTETFDALIGHALVVYAVPAPVVEYASLAPVVSDVAPALAEFVAPVPNVEFGFLGYSSHVFRSSQASWVAWRCCPGNTVLCAHSSHTDVAVSHSPWSRPSFRMF